MKLQILSGNSNRPLAQSIAEKLGLTLTDVYLKSFPSGESYCQIRENIRGNDLFIINGITKPANENLMDMLVIADAARRASAASITAVIPYFGYARQDRKDKSRVPITAKLVLNLLEAAGIKRVLAMDMHSAQIAGFTDLPFDHLYFEPLLINHIKSKMDPSRQYVIVAPDEGAMKRAIRYAKALSLPLALIVKTRISENEVGLDSFVGEVSGKTAIIIDDLTESVGTLKQASEACKLRGANETICAVTHFCPTAQGIINLDTALQTKQINEFICTDTNLVTENIGTKISVAALFANAIRNIHFNRSVSELF